MGVDYYTCNYCEDTFPDCEVTPDVNAECTGAAMSVLSQKVTEKKKMDLLQRVVLVNKGRVATTAGKKIFLI
jgi:hypothetical protein